MHFLHHSYFRLQVLKSNVLVLLLTLFHSLVKLTRLVKLIGQLKLASFDRLVLAILLTPVHYQVYSNPDLLVVAIMAVTNLEK